MVDCLRLSFEIQMIRLTFNGDGPSQHVRQLGFNVLMCDISTLSPH